MPTSRRTVVFFLGVGGAMVATVTAAGFVYRAADRGSFSDLRSGEPFEPWREWRERRYQGAEAVALAGTLAANSHNTQPWLFAVTGDTIDLYANRQSHMLFLDAYDRELLMGLGCCIENMAVAAEGLGKPATVSLFPNPSNTDHVARLTFGPGMPVETPRFLAIGSRRTHRGHYLRDRPLPANMLTSLNQLSPSGPARVILFPAESALGQAFAKGTIEATESIIADPSLLTERYHWFRQTLDQVRATRDGLSFIGSGLTDMQVRAGMALPDIDAASYGQFWLDETRNTHVATAPMFGLISVDDESNPAHLLEAGRLLERLYLEATALGLGFQPLSQMNLMADREQARGRQPLFTDRVRQLAAGTQGAMVVGLRLGFSNMLPRASPRRPFHNALVRHTSIMRTQASAAAPLPQPTGPAPIGAKAASPGRATSPPQPGDVPPMKGPVSNQPE